MFRNKVKLFVIVLPSLNGGHPTGLMRQSELCHKIYPTSILICCIRSKQYTSRLCLFT